MMPRSWNAAGAAALIAGAVFLSVAGSAEAERSVPEPGTVGIFSCLEHPQVLSEYPANSTYLAYSNLDSEKGAPRIAALVEANKKVEADAGRKLNFQLAFELAENDFPSLITAMQDPNSRVSKNIMSFAQSLASQGSHAYVRPFSEMNDIGPEKWKLDPKAAPGKGNSPQNFAKAWTMLRERLVAAGLKDFEMHFNPLVALGVGGASDPGNKEITFKALDLIPEGAVEAFGMNLYVRPRGAPQAPPIYDPEHNPIGTSDQEYVPFAELAQPWIDRLRKSSKPNLKLAVGEMGASNQGFDPAKALWIREAFEFTRTRGFSMLTYFNCLTYNWAAISGSQAEVELRKQLQQGL